ncbi:MAG: hypothetical protein HUU25_01185 [Candidatus Sumerlaeia bacterium]|nr:hypothetical protein [Candidatus Sumerlaeia bacterium]
MWRLPLALMLASTVPRVSPAPVEFPRTWIQDHGFAVINRAGQDARGPEVVRLDDGRWRLFYTVTGQGVASARSEDGVHWAAEAGLRLQSRRVVGRDDFDIANPWLLRLRDGRWRMHFESNTGHRTPTRLRCAISRTDDPLDFDFERTVIEIGPSTGLAQAEQGAALIRSDGVHILLFFGRLLRGEAEGIMLATSPDGLAWEIENRILFPGGQAPALVEFAPGQIACAFQTASSSFAVSTSSDGLTWTPPAPLTLLNRNGRGLSSATDALCLHRLDGGDLRLLANAREGLIALFPAGVLPD